MKTLGAAILLVALALGGLSVSGDRNDAGGPALAGRIYELRTYHVVPGKMQALVDRFRNHTVKLFEKHGMKVVGFWTPTDPKQTQTTLIYVLSFRSREDADRAWTTFQNDPDWQAVKKETEKNGKLVERVDSVFMRPTEFSPLK
jgi:hypothetical protein